MKEQQKRLTDLSRKPVLTVDEYLYCLQHGIPFAPGARGVIPGYGTRLLSDLTRQTITPPARATSQKR